MSELFGHLSECLHEGTADPGALLVEEQPRISARGYWLEIICCEIGVAHGYFYDIHVTTYGEAILLALQSYVIVYLSVKYSGDWSLEMGRGLCQRRLIASHSYKSILLHHL
ncbi:hypothetical protein GBAR_LOCUS25771 [Geodia barretti]|uniref:Uncharacterized protein n=1 Tax=Geodia barretti TaxID=519541 RepID=A0AA35TFC6_GEOBA|nr:hypothetical protein GBAR_LOCUS25771 [Geodia barretti]